jgi:hypothetical protein
MKPLKFIGYTSRIVSNPNITWENIKEIYHEGDIDDLDEDRMDPISNNPNITWDIVKKYPASWNTLYISENKTVTYEIIKANRGYDWVVESLVYNPNLTLDQILELFPEYDLHDIEDFNKNPNITWEYIQARPFIDWDYVDLSNNKNITWDIIKDTPNLWSRAAVTSRLPWSIIKANPTHPWDYRYLQYNSSTTWDEFQDIIAKGIELDFNELTAHPSVTWEIIKSTPHPWNVEMFSSNPNLTWDIVVNNPDVNWWYGVIALNPFQHHRKN